MNGVKDRGRPAHAAILACALLAAACDWFSGAIQAPDADTEDGLELADGETDGTDGEEGEARECTSSADCDDENPCNGVEVCLIEGICMAGDSLPDGADCTTAAGLDGTCREETCVLLTCGNGAVDAGEECDDGNETAGDGCEVDCTYSCRDAAQCSDGDVCNGPEACGAETHRCEPGTAPDDGEPCGESPGRICLEGRCEDSLCGDGYVDAAGGESCEPPGVDACSEDCTWACGSGADCPDDGEMCNGEEFCDTEQHECGRRDVPPAGTVCSTDPYRECLDQRCQDTDLCGNGRIDAGEECDDSSAFCSASCSLTAPSPGWLECSDSTGRTSFLSLQNMTAPHTWSQMRDHCRSVIEGFSPVNFQHYGLAVLTDESVWNCIEPSLDQSDDYFVGVYQDRSASDYSEPDGGFYWTAYDGSGWVNLVAHEPSTFFLVTYFNNAGGTGTMFDCGYVRWRDLSEWQLYDWACSAAETWEGICMIQF